MHKTKMLVIVAMFYASLTSADEMPPLAERLFCDYVSDFAPQIARNRIRLVPFLRLDAFAYFDDTRSQYLQQIARDIYARQPDDLLHSLDSLANQYLEDCRNVFGEA